MKLKYLLFAFTAIWFLAGCTSSVSPKKNLLNIKVIAGKTASPLSIHFFTLKSDNVFKRLDYFELVDSKHVNWNNELLSRAKTLLLPGHTEIFQVPVSSDMQYYALVIGFKDVKDNDNWRYLRQVPLNGESIALRLSQESNGYTSQTVQRLSAKEQVTTSQKSTSHINKIGNKISNKVESRSDQAINSSIDRVIGRIFN